MKRIFLLLCVLLLVLWSFCISGHATHNFERTPAVRFDLGYWDCPARDIGWSVPKVEIITDWDIQLYGQWAQILDSDLTTISAETLPISGSGLLLIFAIGLILVWVSRFGEKFFKNKKR
ncbi:MAG: hypothetical protein ACK2U1_06470 [Anaerolineales bacterium]|jgi:hypothetical protein